ncbi:MAG TPA: hypothetical protein VJN71_00345 [Nitrososphaerales archaeon]|nr:hypothetical protein [Nitrososphaerales archaeon]
MLYWPATDSSNSIHSALLHLKPYFFSLYAIGGIALAAAAAIAIRIIIAVIESREKKISPAKEAKAGIVTEKN